jgi:hypothetical protein
MALVALVDGFAGKSERVGAGAGLGESVGPHPLGRDPREIPRLLGIAPPLQQSVVEERVLNIHEDRHRSVDPRQLLDHHDRHEERGSRPAEILGNLDAHETEFETGIDQIPRHLRLLVHLGDEGADALGREARDRFLEELLVFGEVGEGERSIVGHGSSF